MHIRRFVLFILIVQILLGFWSSAATNAAVLNSQQVASFPFSDDFESGINTNWLTPNEHNGVVEINTVYYHSSKQSVFVGQKIGGAASASLTLAVDLTNQSNVFLDFWVRATGELAYRNVSIILHPTVLKTLTKQRY